MGWGSRLAFHVGWYVLGGSVLTVFLAAGLVLLALTLAGALVLLLALGLAVAAGALLWGRRG